MIRGRDILSGTTAAWLVLHANAHAAPPCYGGGRAIVLKKSGFGRRPAAADLRWTVPIGSGG